MKRVLLAAAALAIAGSVCAGEIPWAKDWASAQAAAKASGKLIMVDFFTEW